MTKKNIIFLLMSSLWIGSSCFPSEVEVVKPVAETLQPRQTNWKPKVTVYHPGGAPETVVFFEDNAKGESIPVKQIKFFENGTPSNEMDLIIVSEDSAGYKAWKNTVVPHGLGVSYFADGKCEKIVHYDRGILHGTVKIFHPNEQLRAEGCFNQGVQCSKIFSYYENGDKLEEGNYVNGKLEGDLCRYFQNGKRQSIVPYKNGVPDGNAIEWFESGSMKASLRYSNGVLHSDGS
ncbi:MAG: toxin-antitoxin system YwqK family antitoxin, partial [Verrucomicrobia bacterium]|nr:toxin-antitoxin system YwqK family antitoxin [Verrucomicrobiota bacterium]